MPELRFRITPELLPEPLLKRAYFAAWGRAPRPTETYLDGEILTVKSNVRGSGTVHILWSHKQLGMTIASTETLGSRTEPFELIQELCRGSLGRLARKVFEWQMLGFYHPAELRDRMTEASRQFSATIFSTQTPREKDQKFAEHLEEFEQIALESTRAFTSQSIAWRTQTGQRLPVQFGTGLAQLPLGTLYEFDLYAKHLQEAFHSVIPKFSWRELEPEQGMFQWDILEQRISNSIRYGLNVVLGPLLSFDKTFFPDWLIPHLKQEGFFESNATRFVNAVAERFGSSVRSWILTDSVNLYHLPELSLPRIVTLTRILASQMKSRGIETPVLVGINQPWSEYAVDAVPEYDHIQIAEALMGCREIDAFLLKINFGFDWDSSFPRNPMEVSHLIDQWSFLGKKVYVSLSVPSMLMPMDSDINEAVAPEYQWSEGLQQFWTENLLKTILGKRMVDGVFWTPLQDVAEQTYSGLIDSAMVLKLAFKHFAALRQSIVQ
ncbi:MAG: beta-galactosidase [Planctomycetaceae bacterium]|nr:beta-galactosidase [Planctomycetaceae bacterium]